MGGIITYRFQRLLEVLLYFEVPDLYVCKLMPLWWGRHRYYSGQIGVRIRVLPVMYLWFYRTHLKIWLSSLAMLIFAFRSSAIIANRLRWHHSFEDVSSKFWYSHCRGCSTRTDRHLDSKSSGDQSTDPCSTILVPLRPERELDIKNHGQVQSLHNAWRTSDVQISKSFAMRTLGLQAWRIVHPLSPYLAKTPTGILMSLIGKILPPLTKIGGMLSCFHLRPPI